MCSLKKRVHERLKTNGTAIKIARETTNNQYKKYHSVKHLKRQQFSFTKTSIKVFLKILSLKASYVYVLSRSPGVCFSQR